MTYLINKIEPAKNIMHQHIAAVINTLLPKVISKNPSRSVQILDIGCGDGELLSHILSSLSFLQPTLVFDLFGLDVSDAGQQDAGFFDKTVTLLLERHPSIDWANKLKLTTVHQKLPFPPERFDFIVSNQVMEHVKDHDFFLREIARCLRPCGVSINLFPTREVLWEGHALMPLVHRIRDVDRRARIIYFFAQLGFKRHYYRDMNRRGWNSLREFAEVFSRVLETDTNYITTHQLRNVANRAGLGISFSYTKDLYKAKALSYTGRHYYKYREIGFAENLALLMFRRLASVTVLLRKVTNKQARSTLDRGFVPDEHQT